MPPPQACDFAGSFGDEADGMSTTDQERFEPLIAEHRAIIYKICRSCERDPNDREDLAQDIVVQLWRSFPSFDGRSAFATWMYRVALNVAISHRRREGRRVPSVGLGDEHLLYATSADSEQPEAIGRLYDFVEQLGVLERAVILLYLEGYPYREIGDIVGISETNVATKLGRLKKRLQIFLTQSVT